MNKKIYLKSLLTPIIIIILTIFTITLFNITDLYKYKKINIDNATKEFIEQNKLKIKTKVHEAVADIEYLKSNNQKNLKSKIKNRVDSLIKTLDAQYKYNQNTKTKKELKEILLRLVKSQNEIGKNNYYFLYDMKTGVALVHNIRNFKGKSFLNYKNKKGIYTFKTKLELLKNKKSSYQELFFEKPAYPNKQFKKLVYISKFEEFNWIIGTGEYLEDNEKIIKQYTADRLNTIQKDLKSYILMMDEFNPTGGNKLAKMIVMPNIPKMVGQYISDETKDIKGTYINKLWIDELIKDGQSFIEYWYKKPNSNEEGKKIAYFYHYKPWNWVIASGFYFDELEEFIKQKETLIDKDIKTKIIESIIIAIIALLISITASYYFTKKITTTIQNINKKLEDKARELKEKNKIVNIAIKAKGEFLANMSHEIRTPLNAIVGFIDILKEESHGRKSMQYVEIIDDSSKNLIQIIEDILDFSKIESGKLNIDKIDFNTKKELEIITYLFEAKCSQKNISLSLNFDDNLPQYINTDPLRIKQIVSNLISNAVKFTKDGKNIFVDIGYKEELLNISVKDEGIGIAKDKLTHIFELFSQEDSSTTRKYGGTGLGLTISKELVKLLGGELKVKSELGKGSEFYFSIPVTIGKKIKTIEADQKDINFKNKKILLVEDNKSNQMFMKVILKKMNLDFDIANDGVEAIEIYKTNKYDAILMDENMPNMNGIRAAKYIIEYEKENNLMHTPVIALTANALKGDREKFIEAGMNEYMTKPLDKQKLIEILESFWKC
ncbi:MAG: cache domain-containing protein [Arcobacteraceae bacterium]|nr:cache domain-containing protein [Arcobacteraceae bacterium]